MRKSITVLSAAAALALVGGVAVASVPDASGVIHGCRKASDGSVRVIDTASTPTCPSGYVALNWSQAGPAGPAGAAGPAGPAGPAGAAGPAGLSDVHIASDQRSVGQAQPGSSPALVRIGCGASPGGAPYQAISGGYRIDSGPLQVIGLQPIPPVPNVGIEWQVTVDSTAGAGLITAYAVCALAG